MVGVGVAEGGGPGGDTYYGEYYPPEQYFVPPEMCPHPQHPQHPHMCTPVPTEYGGVGMPVVTSATMLPQMMPPVLDDSMRHYLMHPQSHPHHQPHHQPPHHQPPHHQPPPHHHQPPHHYGPANGAGGPQQYYGAGYPAAPHYHHIPPHHMQHSPPPPVYQKDERTQRQYSKLKQKLERKQTNRNNGTELNSGGSTPSLSPRKEMNGTRVVAGGAGAAGTVAGAAGAGAGAGTGAGTGAGSGDGSGGGASSGAWSEGEGSSAGASLQGDDDTDTQAVLDMLSATRTPQVSEITPTSALVQWNSPIPEDVTLPQVELTYDLLLGDRGRYKAIYSGPSLSCRVRDLRPGCEYSVCLQIRAGTLTGAASEEATFLAPPAPPPAPPPPRVTQRARSSLLLRWPTVPDNGARLTHYLLEMEGGGDDEFVEIARPRTRQHTANNLRPQTRYRFRLAAVNECGRGAWSDAVAVWTAGAPPAAPRAPHLAAAAPNSLQLSWERRAPEEEFTLQMDDRARGHGFLPVYSGPELGHACAGLHRATDYRFRLRCETADGQGPWSTEVSYRTLPERPGPPGRPAVRGKVHSRAFRLRWDEPAEDGGARVDSYLLELDGGEGYGEAYSGPEREAHCDRLRPGAQYRARVRCSNAAGVSEWSATETVMTEAACPGECAAPEPAGEPRATSAAVRWRPPESDGGAAITEYKLEVIDSSGEVKSAYSGALLEFVVRELSPGQEYQMKVCACNRVGAGPLSACLRVTTAAAPPTAPAAPLLTIETPQTALLEWNAPADNGSPILDYRLEMSTADVDEAFSEIYKGSETRYLVKNLVPFSPYFFRVCATNSAGRGPRSATRDALMPRAPPAAPAGLRHEATADSIRLFWKAPADHGAEILKYKVEVDDVENETDGPTAEFVLEGLSPDSAHRVRVAAVNELGVGEFCESARFATRPPPPRPPALECAQRAHNYLKLKWGEGAAQDSTQYCLEMRGPDGREFRPAYRGSARSCKVKKLREDTAYAFRIRASDERGGRGEFSAPLEARTGSAPPPAPRNVALEAHGPRSALARWEPVERATYAVQVARGREAPYRPVYAGAAAECALEELEPGAEYAVRVCAVRAGLAGPWSPAARLLAPCPPPAAPRVRRPRAPRSLSARHEAMLLVAGFLLLALAVAVLVQRLVDARG